MKHLKPGQLVTINNTVYRVVKRRYGCIGCVLNDFFTCPNIIDSRSNKERPIDCPGDDIILRRLRPKMRY